ncbi:hypothetical protein B0H16DRAFT_1693380 [Mycena metata]|uniref:Uncharacterized protein n=1 Tax=Mycena metata TaxID=1033252 RepID=A0AAD7IIK2_9AGAR|nr:hypothetical protein B0H16DRAFT_1693380 [Mycena metata]
MDCVLPDEIISEILSPALKISDEIFSDTLSISPFALHGHSTSAYLLVCKAWLRVSTPLLYNVVILRSKAQAEALEAALESNKDLGSFIRKLRVEGGYGITMRTILKASGPNITDLLLTLAIWSSDAVSGLCQSLSLVDPIRLILHDVGGPGDNKQNLQLTKKVAEYIQLWKRLKIVDIPFTLGWSTSNMNRCDVICEALKTAPSVEEVIIPVPTFMAMPPYLAKIRQNPVLKRVTLKQPVPWDWALELRAYIDSDPLFKDLVKFSISDVDRPPEIAPPSNPLFTPMDSVPQDVQDKIWSRIFYFVFEVDVLEEHLASDINIFRSQEPIRDIFIESQFPSLSTMLVSKQFKRLSTPYFYRHVVLVEYGDFDRFSAALLGDPCIGKHLISLAVTQDAVMPEIRDSASYNFEESEEEQHNMPPKAQEHLLAMLPLLDGLVSFTGGFYNVAIYPPQPQIYHDTLAMPWIAFQVLASAAGATLRRFCLQVVPPVEAQSPLVLEPFSALRSMEWKCLVEFNLESTPMLAPGALANLECISLVDYHPSLLDVLAAAELPALRRLFFHTNVARNAEHFLKRHGSKLTELMIVTVDSKDVNVLDACPDLPVLICCTHDTDTKYVLPSIELFTPSQPHLRLTKIVLDVSLYSRKEEQTMEKFIKAIDPSLLPALREIQISQLFWPATERDIAKSVWVPWAEYLLAKDIKLTDPDGRHWTPRLSTVKAARVSTLRAGRRR